MSILDKLWDDTVAGPRPDTGLGKLRKSSTFSFGSNSGKESEASRDSAAAKVTRSITIVKPPVLGNLSKDSPPVSPAGSTPPVSPFAGSGGKEAFRFRRRTGPFSYENAPGVGPRSPPAPYDM